MKSLAYVLTGIALITIVVPVNFIAHVAAQSGTLQQYYCKIYPANPTQDPEFVDCDETKGDCPAEFQKHFFDLGECIHNGSESTSCYYYHAPAWRGIPIDFIPHNSYWLIYVELGNAGAAALAAFIAGVIICKSCGAGAIITYGGGATVAVTCGAITKCFDTPIPKCGFGVCKRNFTVPTVVGPRKMMCE